MSAEKNVNQVIPHHVGLPYGQMSGTQKVVFLLKLVVCIATFGFAFPNVQHD